VPAEKGAHEQLVSSTSQLHEVQLQPPLLG
jgi:hypothetical protein